MKKSAKKIEFGDFQTPLQLARDVARTLADFDISPTSIIEPTCGRGAFLLASAEVFKSAQTIVGCEIDESHFKYAANSVENVSKNCNFDLMLGDFFLVDWKERLRKLPGPRLIIGNPPWVTSSQLGSINSLNLPQKSNFQKMRGIDAITGKSNFDIAEFIVSCLIDCLTSTGDALAMLVKSTVARRIVRSRWLNQNDCFEFRIIQFDTKAHFNISADGCVLIARKSQDGCDRICRVSDLDNPLETSNSMSVFDDRLVANMDALENTAPTLLLFPPAHALKWRSGVKHDCSKILELRRDDVGRLTNGLGELVDVEDAYRFPLMKGSDVANGKASNISKEIIVPQFKPGQPTGQLKSEAPKLFKYLENYEYLFAKRKSSIYRQKDRFSIFGVGEYTFSPWKIAICSLYKRLGFRLIGPYQQKPVVFDDTVYFLSCDTRIQAELLHELFVSEFATNFLNAFIFWDAKRPITTEILGLLDIQKLADLVWSHDQNKRQKIDSLNLGVTQPVLF